MGSSQRGLTLIEVLVAAAIVTVGLTAVAAGFQHALSAVEAGRRQTIALFLAQQRLEEVRAMAVVDFDALMRATFPLEDEVPGYPPYRRVVEVTSRPAGMVDAARVRVSVADRSAAEVTVSLVTVLARRR